MIRLEMIFG